MRLLPLLALVAVLPAGAQQMYRCGNTFSQTPCGAGQQAIGDPAPGPRTAAQPSVPAAPDLPASPDTVEAAKAGCLDRLRRDIAFRDPDSVKVQRIERRGIYHVGDGKTASRVYLMEVNAKNAYGGYAGAKDYFCHTDPRNERVVLLVAPTSY